jgi:putative membrane protein
MDFLLQLIVTPLIIAAAAKLTSGIYIKDIKAAFWTSFWIIVVGFLIGWLITFLLNVLTLGLLWLVGLGIITRTIAYAIIIEIIDRMRDDFDTKGLSYSLYLAIFLAIAWGILDWMF